MGFLLFPSIYPALPFNKAFLASKEIRHGAMRHLHQFLC